MKNEFPLSFDDIIDDSSKRKLEVQRNPTPICLLLDQPELPRNIAAINRLADAARIEKLYIYGEAPPESKRKKTERISRNAIQKVPTEYLVELSSVKALAEKQRFIALEYTNKSQPFHTYKDDMPCILVIGNERSGVSKELLEFCERSLHIPMLGENSSMNVAVATGIVVYHLLGNMNRI